MINDYLNDVFTNVNGSHDAPYAGLISNEPVFYPKSDDGNSNHDYSIYEEEKVK